MIFGHTWRMLMTMGMVSLCAMPLDARELVRKESEDGAELYNFKLSSSLKLAGLVSAPHFDSDPPPRDPSANALLRLRVEPAFEAGSWKVAAAYDNQLYWTSDSQRSASFALPLSTTIPFRFWQLAYKADWESVVDLQQLDRAFVSFKSERLEVIVGRQAIGWGRGTMFSAVDIFVPFSPLQVDQEWRSGVDALNIDFKISDTTSFQAVATGAESWNQAALGGRLRGYFGVADAEVIVAKRERDVLYGFATSAAVADLELHAELALFDTPGDVKSSGIFGVTSLVPKSVVGISNFFDVGNGLTAGLEYHYSGFGVSNANALATVFRDAAFMSRYAKGHMQTIGAHTIGLQASYVVNESWTASFAWLQSAVDGSGVLSPSAVWNFSDFGSLLANAIIGYGARRLNGALQSEYGSLSPSLVVQLRLYD